MKQVTGATNSQSKHTDVSIQLRLDGHSFSMESLSGRISGGKGKKTIEVISAKTILVPRELFDPQSADYLLELSGMALSGSETVIYSDPKSQAIALMGVEENAIRQLEKTLPGAPVWSSPLLHTPTVSTPTIWLFRYEELVYLKIWGPDRALRLAEVLPAPTPEDTLFYITEFVRDMNLSDYPILTGKSAADDAHLLKKYFKRVTLCE